MKKILFHALLISLFLGATALAALADMDHEGHHMGDPTAHGMMAHKGMGMGMEQMPCRLSGDDRPGMHMMGMMKEGMGGMMGAGMSHMMGSEKMGMMGQRMDHLFFLDRAEELGLSAEQVSKLKTLKSECRKDNIRAAAEAKIARLDLSDLLAGDSWTLKDAETLVRKIQTLEGDIQVRHLKAISDARKVLTPEQLKQSSADASGNLESLFQ